MLGQICINLWRMSSFAYLFTFHFFILFKIYLFLFIYPSLFLSFNMLLILYLFYKIILNTFINKKIIIGHYSATNTIQPSSPHTHIFFIWCHLFSTCMLVWGLNWLYLVLFLMLSLFSSCLSIKCHMCFIRELSRFIGGYVGW